MRLRLVVIGRDRRDPLCEAAASYLERVRRYFPVELVELKEEPARKSTPVDRVRSTEAERIKKAIKGTDVVVALDERGKTLTSPDVAARLARWAGEGRGSVDFVIGGPEGLDPALLSEVARRWSLSRLTLPHRMARLVLAEQLYRGCTIMKREPYHK